MSYEAINFGKKFTLFDEQWQPKVVAEINDYPCAPPARAKGSARLFDEASLLPPFFFARLMEFGLTVGRAAQLACEMGQTASSDYAEPASRIIFVQGTMSDFFKTDKEKVPSTGEVRPAYNPDHETTKTKEFPNGMGYGGAGRVLFTIDFYVKHVREIIADRLAYELSKFGPEDE